MLRLAADENFKGDIVRGLLRAIRWSISFGFKTLGCQAPTILRFSDGPPRRIA